MEKNSVVQEKAYAKLNLTLKVLNKLSNNYHEIESHIVFLPKVFDKLIVKKSKLNKVLVSGEFAKILLNNGGDTLIYKSIKLLSELLRIKINIEVRLQKNIPLGSGLGGGSADAAAVVRAIIKLYKTANKKDLIVKNLHKIGSDVPVCFFSKNAKVTGIGEQIKPLKKLDKKLWILLLKPNNNSSTQLVFNKLKKPFQKESSFCFNLKNIISDMNKNKNSLENTACKLDNNLAKTLSSLPNHKNLAKPRITGSGSTIFVIFENKKNLLDYKNKVKIDNKKYWQKSTFLEL